MSEQIEGQAVTCPFLGIDQDATTSFGFLTDDNRCWRLKRPAEVSPNHQAKYCFSPEFTACPVYTSAKLSSGVKFARGGEAGRSLFSWRALVVLFEAILAIAVLGALGYIWIAIPATPSPTIPSIATSTRHPTDIAIVAVPTALPTLAVTVPPIYATSLADITLTPPTPTASVFPPTFTAAPGLEQAIGPYNLVAHQIVAGESLIDIAAHFSTNVDVLEKVNGITNGQLLVGHVLVVPQGMTNVGPLTKMVAFQTIQDTQLSAIVSQLSVDIVTVKTLNALGDGDTVPAGRWLFIPQP